jgi:hypothetical protein
VFGSINITLRGPVSPSASDETPAATPAPGLAPGTDSARWGGRVRQTELPPDSLPGAERLGVPAPQAPQALPVAPPQAPPVATPQAAPAAAPPDPAPDPTAAAQDPAPAAAPAPAAPAAPVTQKRSLSAPLLPPVRAGLPALAREPGLAAGADLQALPRTVAAHTVSLPNLPTPPAPGTLVQTPGNAGPDAGSRVGHDVATPAAAAASQPPRLNLELARPRGGELSRFATSGALPVLPRPPEVDEQLARDIEKAGKADCRKAYAGAGLLAVVPLLADAAKGSGCKW